jgi:hypothetical protein
MSAKIQTLLQYNMQRRAKSAYGINPQKIHPRGKKKVDAKTWKRATMVFT